MNVLLIALLSTAFLFDQGIVAGEKPSLQVNVSDTLNRTLEIGLARDRPSLLPPSDSRSGSPARRRSLLEPTIFVMTYHTIGMAMLVSMDPKETGFQPMHVKNWAGGFRRPPIWENDSWITNYLLHPAWGSETYLQARHAGFGAFESFLFSSAASVAWEYGFESWAEHPSAQDLLVTSTVGSVLGELRFMLNQTLQRQEALWATAALILLDPLGTSFRYSTALVGDAAQRIATSFRSGVSIRPALTRDEHRSALSSVGFQVSVPL